VETRSSRGLCFKRGQRCRREERLEEKVLWEERTGLTRKEVSLGVPFGKDLGSQVRAARGERAGDRDYLRTKKGKGTDERLRGFRLGKIRDFRVQRG